MLASYATSIVLMTALAATVWYVLTDDPRLKRVLGWLIAGLLAMLAFAILAVVGCVATWLIAGPPSPRGP